MPIRGRQSGRSCCRSPEAVASRSPDAATASFRGLVSSTTPRTTIGTQIFRLAINDLFVLFFLSQQNHFLSHNFPSEASLPMVGR